MGRHINWITRIRLNQAILIGILLKKTIMILMGSLILRI